MLSRASMCRAVSAPGGQPAAMAAWRSTLVLMAAGRPASRSARQAPSASRVSSAWVAARSSSTSASALIWLALRAACTALGLQPWDDPHNADPVYARARVRHQALPALEAALGPGVAEALARSASQIRADAEVLDDLAASEAELARDGDGAWRADRLAGLPAAIRTRVLRLAAIAGGCPAGALTARHIEALDCLLTSWHGQRWTDLPGGIRGTRHCGKLLFTAGDRGGPAGGGKAEGPVGRQ